MGLVGSFKYQTSIEMVIQIQWGFEYRTRSDFEWLKAVPLLDGSDFEWFGSVFGCSFAV